jgi:hypothetical protein
MDGDVIYTKYYKPSRNKKNKLGGTCNAGYWVRNMVSEK